MKKLFFLLAVFACTLTAGAQNKGYNHVNFGYNGYLVDNFPDMHGFRVGYARGINLKSTLPLYIEVGGQLVYGYNSYRAEKYDYIRLAIPVNVTYRFSVGDNWKIAPYAGLALGINCLAQERERLEYPSLTSGIQAEYKPHGKQAATLRSRNSCSAWNMV